MMSYFDNCTDCDEKNITIEYQQGQLDSIRLLIETEEKLSSNVGITALYHRRSELRDNIYAVLEQ